MDNKRPMAVVTAPGKIELQDVPLPTPGPTELVIQVKAVTICGSDIHIFKGKHPSVELPIPVGHEIAGEVVEVGESVTNVKIHDRVCVEPVITCDNCFYCKRGDYHLCSNISFQYRRWQGGFTPFFIVDERWCHKLPDQLSYLEGALLEPLAVAVHAVRKAGINLGDSAAVYGDGAIGLLIVEAARASGAGDIHLVGIRNHRLNVGLKIGASHIYNGISENPVTGILRATQGRGVACSFEAVGIEQTLLQTIHSTEKGGTAVLIGLFEKTNITINPNLIVQRELVVKGSQGYCWDFQRALKMVESGLVSLAPLITHRFPLGDVQAAFDLLMDPDEEAIKVAIELD